MSAFGPPKSPQSTSFSGPQTASQQDVTNSASPQHSAAPARDSPQPRTRTERASSRPMSMVQTYQPPMMEIAQDTIPELQPIFTFLNSHANKLYQEGYFLKLNDLDSRTCAIEGLPQSLLISSRWATERGQIVDGIVCPARWHSTLTMGCFCSGCRGPRWRGSAHIYQSSRCFYQDGTAIHCFHPLLALALTS